MFDHDALREMSTPVLTILAAHEVRQLNRPAVEFDSLKYEAHIEEHRANLFEIDGVLRAREREGR